MKEITKTNLFKEIVELKTWVTAMKETNHNTRSMFVWMVILILLVDFINMALNMLLIYHFTALL